MRSILIVLVTLCSLNIYGQDTIVKMEPITLIGIRADTKTPVTQKTVKKEEIQKTYQGQEVPVLLDKTPSVTSSTDGGHPQGYTYFRIRGIDQTRINMTLNGVPLNEPEDQGVYTSNYPGFTNVLQSFQIQRGVGTSTNGTASFGGSINFQSQSGFEKANEISLGYGSFNTQRINYMSSSGLKDDKWSFFTNISAYSTDGYRERSGGNGVSGLVSGGYYGDKDILKFTAFTGFSTNQMAWLAVDEDEIKTNPKTNYNINDAEDDFSQTFAQLQYIKKFDSTSKLSSSVFFNVLDGRYDYFMSGNTSIFLNSAFFGFTSNYQYTKKNLKVNLGVNINTYSRTHTNKEDHSDDYGIGLYKNTGYRNEYAGFTKIAYDISKLTLFGDIQFRYTDFRYTGSQKMDELSWNFVNPKAGLMFTQNKQLNYYFSVGKTHREPTRTNLFGGQDNLTTLLDIKPEEVVDYELGMNLNQKDVSLQTNFYYMKFKNEITLLGALGSNGLPLMTNVTSSFRSGLEVDFTAKNIYDIFTLGTNLNYSYNRIKDGGKTFEPLYTPRLVINQTAGIEYKGLTVSLSGKYHSKSYISFDNQFITPEFFLLGANAGITIKRYTLLLQANNLTNKTFFTNGYVSEGKRYFFANALASFYATFKFKF